MSSIARCFSSAVTLSIAVCALAVLPAGVGASPVTLTVNEQSDGVDASPGDGLCATSGGTCTVRAAIQEANSLFGPNTIEVPEGLYQLSLPDDGQDSNAANGDIDILDPVTINGAGATTTIIDGGAHDRVFDVSGGVPAEISGMSIRNGNTPFGGGGIQSGGNLTLEDVLVAGSTSGLDGGGIQITSGSLSMVESRIDQNVATRDGGGILAATTSSLSIVDSDLTGNSGRVGGGLMNRSTDAELTGVIVSDNEDTDGGGGIHNEGTLTLVASVVFANAGTSGGGIANIGTATITNSTFSGNTASSTGGGVYNVGTASLTNVTIAENSGVFGGGIDNSGTATLVNTILESGQSGSNCPGAVTSLGHNVSSDGSCAAFLTQTGDVNAHSALLEPLAANGGRTQTHALMEGSPALDAGDDGACPATDQRGITRPQGSACDIGAYEAGEPGPPPLRQGDVDCVGFVSVIDALILLLNHSDLPLLQRGDGCPPLTLAFGDVNCDGVLDEQDAMAIVAYVAGTPYSHEDGCTQIGQLLPA